MKPAPIALFVYNRPEHTLRTLEALRKNEGAEGSELYIFADGVKENAGVSERNKVESVQKIIREVSGFSKITIETAERNKGLAASLTYGIEKVLQHTETVIVLEDDILALPSFLSFCNEALEKYKGNETVMAVSGYAYPIEGTNETAYFLKTGACWGWATWRRAWKHFQPDAGALLQELEERTEVNEFNFSGSNDYSGMLRMHIDGRISSWAVCWYASVFLKGGLTVYPPASLTVNTGMDGSGTHYNTPVREKEVLGSAKSAPVTWNFPNEVQVDQNATQKLTAYFWSQQERSLKQKVKGFLKKNIFTR